MTSPVKIVFLFVRRMDFNQTYIPHGYKEIQMLPKKNGDVGFLLLPIMSLKHLPFLSLNFSRICDLAIF